MPNLPSTAMNLPLPSPNSDDGIWGIELNNNCFSVIGNHTHTGSGDGYQLGVASLAIDGNLSFNRSYGLTDVRAVGLETQLAPISATEQGIVYKSGNELYYNDSSNHQVQITLNGAVNASGSGSGDFVQETINANFTVDPNSSTNWFNADTSGASFVFTLPQTTDVGTKGYYVRDYSGTFGSNNLTVACQGSDTILDSADTSAFLKIPFGTYLIVSDGNNHWSIDVSSNYQNNLGNYTMVSLAISGSETVGGDLTVDGYGNFSGFLSVTGLADFFQAVNVHSGGSFHVVGSPSGPTGPDVSFGSATRTVGTFENYFPADFYAATTWHDSHILLSGTSTLQTHSVTLGVNSGDTITVNGTTSFENPVIFDDNITVNSGHSFTVNTAVTINDNLTQTGNTTLGTNSSNTVTVKGGLDVKHSSTFEANLEIVGNLQGDADTSLSGGEITSSSSTHLTTIGAGSTSVVSLTANNAIFDCYTSYTGDDNRPLLKVITLSSSSDVNIKYKYVIVSGAITSDITVNFTSTTGMFVGDYWTVVNRSFLHSVTVTSNGNTFGFNVLGANEWQTMVNASGGDTGWQLIGRGNN